MRLPYGRLLAVSVAVAGWASAIAAALQVVHAGGGNTDGSNAVILFASDDFSSNLAAEPVFESTNANKTFRFSSAAKNLTVDSVTLYLSTGVVLGTAQPDGDGASAAPAAASKRDASTVPLSLTVTPTQGQDETNGIITLLKTQPLVESYSGQALYFEIQWTLPSAGRGATYSRSFTYVSPAAFSSVLTESLFTNTYPAHPETKFGGSSTVSGSSSTADLVATVAPTTSLKTAAATVASTTSTAPASSSQKKKGISGGAIAGIVIGVLAGVAIVAALLFWLMRKRRESARAQGLLSGPAEPYLDAGAAAGTAPRRAGPQNGTGSPTADNLMAEKDADARAAASGGTQGPYSDDDGAREVSSSVPAVTVSGAAAAASAASAAPVARAASVAPSASSVDISTPAAASGSAGAAPAIPGQVAALIEDHMTPEDVARLEAEERQLDADIENAIRNRANAGSR